MGKIRLELILKKPELRTCIFCKKKMIPKLEIDNSIPMYRVNCSICKKQLAAGGALNRKL